MLRHFVAASAALCLVACATPYQSSGLGGGYKDTKIDDSHYRVGFYGNGYASQERVWYFWIYRCAELTVKNGYTYFSLSAVPAAPAATAAPTPAKTLGPSDAQRPRLQSAVFRQTEDQAQFIRIAHGGGGGGYTTYVPGGTIRTWHTDAIVNMYPTDLPEGAATVLRAQEVMDAIGPYVRADGKIAPIDRAALMARASMVTKLGAGYQAFINSLAADRSAAVAGPPNNVAKVQAAQAVLVQYPQSPTWTATGPGEVYLNDASVSGAPPDAVVFVVGSLDLAVGSEKLYRFSRYIANCDTNSAQILNDTPLANNVTTIVAPPVAGPLSFTAQSRAPIDLSAAIPMACKYRGYKPAGAATT